MVEKTCAACDCKLDDGAIKVTVGTHVVEVCCESVLREAALAVDFLTHSVRTVETDNRQGADGLYPSRCVGRWVSAAATRSFIASSRLIADIWVGWPICGR
jgi:hypothetical protein